MPSGLLIRVLQCNRSYAPAHWRLSDCTGRSPDEEIYGKPGYIKWKSHGFTAGSDDDPPAGSLGGVFELDFFDFEIAPDAVGFGKVLGGSGLPAQLDLMLHVLFR